MILHRERNASAKFKTNLCFFNDDRAIQEFLPLFSILLVTGPEIVLLRVAKLSRGPFSLVLGSRLGTAGGGATAVGVAAGEAVGVAAAGGGACTGTAAAGTLAITDTQTQVRISTSFLVVHYYSIFSEPNK